MKRIIKLTESDLQRIVKRVIKESRKSQPDLEKEWSQQQVKETPDGFYVILGKGVSPNQSFAIKLSNSNATQILMSKLPKDEYTLNGFAKTGDEFMFQEGNNYVYYSYFKVPKVKQ